MLIKNILETLLCWIYCLDIPDIVLLITAVTAVFIYLHRRLRGKAWWSLLLVLALAFWMIGVISSTVSIRTVEQQMNCNMIPFHSYQEVLNGGNREILRSNFMNVVLFYPAGLIGVSLLPPKGKSWVFGAIIVNALVAVSIGIECIQYYYALGNCEIDDVLHNSLGALLGSLVSFCTRNRTVK